MGAIRWDAWYDPGSVETQAVSRTLSARLYAERAPFFAAVSPESAVRLPRATASLIETEARLAAFGGLDYWAFVSYPAASSMSLALRLYLAGKARSVMRFCLFAQMVSWGRTGAASEEQAWHIALMGSDAYLRVGGRPLYFLGFLSAAAIVARWGDVAAFRAEIRRFRDAARAAGRGNPLIVAAGAVRETSALALALGADAVGAYTIADGRAAGTFADLVATNRQGWETLAKGGLPVVPTVMAGWNRRPRVEHPVPWEHGQTQGAGRVYGYATGTPQEIADLLSDALRWSAQRAAPAVLIYAWNENDEGGWLVPTKGCDAGRLMALRRVLLVEKRLERARC